MPNRKYNQLFQTVWVIQSSAESLNPGCEIPRGYTPGVNTGSTVTFWPTTVYPLISLYRTALLDPLTIHVIKLSITTGHKFSIIEENLCPVILKSVTWIVMESNDTVRYKEKGSTRMFNYGLICSGFRYTSFLYHFCSNQQCLYSVSVTCKPIFSSGSTDKSKIRPSKLIQPT